MKLDFAEKILKDNERVLPEGKGNLVPQENKGKLRYVVMEAKVYQILEQEMPYQIRVII